jgi:predicted N-acetyltransferase YhbS
MLRTRSKDTLTQKSLHHVEENISRFWADLGTEMHFSIEKTQLFTNIHHPSFNGVLRSNFPAAIASKRVSEIIQQFEDRRLPFRWIIHDQSRPGNIKKILIDNGLQHTESWSGLYHNLHNTPSYNSETQQITIQPITSYDAMMIWAANFSECMNVPFKEAKKYADLFTKQGVKPFRHFIASQDGICVGVASLYFLSKVVGIYNLTVKQSVRGQGVGSSIVNYLLTHAKKIGSEGVVLYVPADRQEGYHHLGFKHVKDFDIFEHPHKA